MITPITNFAAKPTPGAGRGKDLGTPTINLQTDAALSIDHGIYACIATYTHKAFPAVMHYGPSPVYNEPVSIEVHILDEKVENPPETLEIAVIERIRDVEDFPNEEALIQQIEQDKESARGILTA